MKNNRYLTAGEFAKTAGTTKDTLFHYDDIGLFSPQMRADNGYRYYSVEQLETFDVIYTLRELDMPLSEIRQYLEHRSPEAFLELLDREEEIVRQKMRRLKKTGRWIREKSLQIENCVAVEQALSAACAGGMQNCGIGITDFPEQYMVCAYSAQSEDMEVARKIGDLYDYCDQAGYKTVYNVGYIQYEENLKRGIYDEYHTMYILFDAAPVKLEYKTRPGGCYLCAYHLGHWDKIKDTYSKLFKYAADRQLKLDTEFYEDYILDALTVNSVEDYITRIAVRIIYSQKE